MTYALRLLLALTLLHPRWQYRMAPALTSELAIIARQYHTPAALLLAVATHESGAGTAGRYLMGVATDDVLGMVRRGRFRPTNDIDRDQLRAGATVLARGLARCGGAWEQAANYYRSGRCTPTPTDYGPRVAHLARALDATAIRLRRNH